jgi:hypothetical protein
LQGTHDVAPTLQRIQDENVRVRWLSSRTVTAQALVASMILIDPRERCTAAVGLHAFRRTGPITLRSCLAEKIFPEYFTSYLRSYMTAFVKQPPLSSDQRVIKCV